MNKLTLLKSLIMLAILIIPVFGFVTFVIRATTTQSHPFKTILAERGEEADEEEEDREESDDKETVVYEDQIVAQNATVIPAPEPSVPVIRYITVVDPGYNIDTDKDGLVDALDPNPTIPEFMFYTDTDNDGIPDASDSYNGEDDFKYIGFEDSNGNGILDIFENLK